MSQAYALPRIRIRRRRWRPPSGWIIMASVYIGICLNQIAYLMIQFMRGEWFGAVIIPVWALIHLAQRRFIQSRRQLEERYDLPMRPPPLILWVIMASLVFVCIEEWFVLL